MDENTQNAEIDATETAEDSNNTGSGLAAVGITLILAFATGAIAAVGNRIVHRIDRGIDARAANKRAKEAIIIVAEPEEELEN